MTSYKHDVMTPDRFRRYEKGVEAYKDVQVIQGPVCCAGGVRSYGTTTSGIMFIGISPARDETTRTKRPLTGPSGQLLDAFLEAVGLKRQDVYCTNLVCTWMNEPSNEDINRCKDRLLYEIKVLKPKFIVLLGTLVTETFFPEHTFNKVRGAVEWMEEYNAYVMGTYHPAAILRQLDDSEYGEGESKFSDMKAHFYKDIKKLTTVPNWEPGAPLAKIRYRVVNSIEQAQNVLDNLPRSPDFPVALDVETTYGRDDEEVEVFKDDVLCVGVGTDNFAWVFTPSALYHEDGTPALVWPDLWWTMHNSPFDAQVVRRKLGQWITVHEDTMFESYSLDERSGIHRLKVIARELLACGFYEETRYKGKLPLDKIPKSMLYEYNAKDVIYTARIHNIQKPLQIADNVRGFYERILIPAVNMFKEVQFHGVNIDMELHKKLKIDWCINWLVMEQELQAMVQEYGWEGEINLNSGQQLARFIFGTLELPIIKRTKKGAPSIDKETFEKLRDAHPFVAKLEEYRKLTKMIGTYISELSDKLKVDGRAHPIVKLHGTVTGRPSYTDLAIQTFVRPDTKSVYNQMRQLIIPPPYEGYEGTDGYIPPEDDEYVIVEVDYGKAELWMAYNYSRDPQMLKDLLSGDYHTVIAADVFKTTMELVDGDQRNTAKRVSFGILYDVEANTLSKQTKSTKEDAQQRIDIWNKRNKVHHEWALETQRLIREHGEIATKTGRKRRIVILGNTVRAEKQAVNFPIQSTSSDVVIDSAVEMHPKLKAIGSHILFTVHDSIVTKALRSRLQEHCKIMHDVMTARRFPNVVPIPIEIKIGPNWGQVKGVHDCSEVFKKNPYGIDLGEKCLWNWDMES